MIRNKDGTFKQQYNTIKEYKDYCEMIVKYKDKSFTILFDIEDKDLVLSNGKWFANPTHSNCKKIYYYIYNNKSIALHRLIMDCPKGFEVDHINHDTLDNRKSNLRICTHRENCQNKINNNKIRNIRLTKSGKYQARFRFKNKETSKVFNSLCEAKEWLDGKIKSIFV